MLKTILIILLVVYGLIYFVFAAKTKKPFKTILSFAALGLLAMTLINLTSKYSGVHLPVNAYTVTVNAVFGLPATITLLFLRMIFL